MPAIDSSILPMFLGNINPLDFCDRQSRRIEIVYRNEEEGTELLSRVYFNAGSEVISINITYLIIVPISVYTITLCA